MIKIASLTRRTIELLKIAAPLMISLFSSLTMVFANRIFLANYSIDALSAMVSSGTVAFSLTFGVQTLTMIASVFVAQLNGAKKVQELGAPVWQMIWLSLMSYVVVIPLALLAKVMLFKHSPIAAQQILVFQCIMLLSPLFALIGSLQSFYTGQGKTLVVTYISIIGNVINIILDPIFIFGIKGIIPSLGIVGAHLANAIGLTIILIMYVMLFLKQENRERFGTNKWRFNLPLFTACIKVGSPEAIAVGAEILCWGLFYNMMASLGKLYIVITAITQSIILLFFFFGLGLEQGASVLAGNFIGAKRQHEVHEIMYAGGVLIVINTALLVTIFINFSEYIIHWFFYNQANIDDISQNTLTIAMPIMQQYLPVIALYIGFEAIRWTINGLLRAAGDTFFLLWVGVVNILVFMIIPTYVLMVVCKLPVQLFFYIWISFAIISSIISYLRFNYGNWKNIVIIRQ